MAYEKVGWKDYPSIDTPINAENLNHMDKQIETNTLAVIQLQEQVNNCLPIDGVAAATYADLRYKDLPATFDCNLALSRLTEKDKKLKKITYSGTNKTTTLLNGGISIPSQATTVRYQIEEELACFTDTSILILQTLKYLEDDSAFFSRYATASGLDVSNFTDENLKYGDWILKRVINAADYTSFQNGGTDSGWKDCTLGGYAESGTIQYRTVGKQITVYGDSVVLSNDVTATRPAPQALATCAKSFANIKQCYGVGRFGTHMVMVGLTRYSDDNIIHILPEETIPAGTTGYFSVTGFID